MQQTQQQQWPYYLVGRRGWCRRLEQHAYYHLNPRQVNHRWKVPGNTQVRGERLSRAAALEQITDLQLKGLRPTQLASANPNPMWRRALSEIELFFRTSASFLYFAGLGAFTGVYVVQVGLSKWYEWVIFLVALTVGALLTRAKKISFWGASVEIEQLTPYMLDQARQQGWWQGYQWAWQSLQTTPQPQTQSSETNRTDMPIDPP